MSAEDSRRRADAARKATRRKRTGSRATGTNPRATGTNPRAKGTNPFATNPTDVYLFSQRRRELARIRQATARLHTRGDCWCDLCSDTGWLQPAHMPEPSELTRCEHVPMTYAEALLILEGGWDE
jgi:hypothetical protein